MSCGSNVDRFISKLTEYLELEEYITPQTKAEIFDTMEKYGEWSELMNEPAIARNASKSPTATLVHIRPKHL
jgi:hypothetical protein